MKDHARYALKNWTELNDAIARVGKGKLTTDDLQDMLVYEEGEDGKGRGTFIKRIKQRLNGLHMQEHLIKV